MSRIAKRQRVADLIVGVLTGQIIVREALLKFPSTADKSVKCAWHALMHLEADEAVRARDVEFRQEQDEFLMFLADLLKRGEDLPANILSEYENYYGEAVLPVNKDSFLSKLLAFLRFTHL